MATERWASARRSRCCCARNGVSVFRVGSMCSQRGPAGVPLALFASEQRSQVAHRIRARFRPTHAAAPQPLVHRLLAGLLHRATPDQPALGTVARVIHAVRLVPDVVHQLAVRPMGLGGPTRHIDSPGRPPPPARPTTPYCSPRSWPRRPSSSPGTGRWPTPRSTARATAGTPGRSRGAGRRHPVRPPQPAATNGPKRSTAARWVSDSRRSRRGTATAGCMASGGKPSPPKDSTEQLEA